MNHCIHVPPSPGQNLCQCKHQQIEMEYAARIAEAQRPSLLRFIQLRLRRWTRPS